MRELVALNLESPVSRPITLQHLIHTHDRPSFSALSSFMYDYCNEIMIGVYADCLVMSRLACYQKEYCSAASKYSGGGPDVSVEGFSKDMLYLMVQIQYLDRYVKCYKKLLYE